MATESFKKAEKAIQEFGGDTTLDKHGWIDEAEELIDTLETMVTAVREDIKREEE